MKYYVLMNDYSSSIVPKYLHAIVDVKKQVNENWEYEGSQYSFPHYLTDENCPSELFLLCNKDIGALRFEYYKHNKSHILSNSLLRVFNNKSSSQYISKKLSATSIKNGDILRDDLNYMYFIGGDDLVNFGLSELEEDRFGDIVPYKLVFNHQASDYDFFSIRKTLLGGYIFVSENFAIEIEKEKIKGIKLVDADKAFDQYCIDNRYDINDRKKKIKKKLP